MDPTSAVAIGMQPCGEGSPTVNSAPHFGLLKILFSEDHATTRQQAMMEKE